LRENSLGKENCIIAAILSIWAQKPMVPYNKFDQGSRSPLGAPIGMELVAVRQRS